MLSLGAKRSIAMTIAVAVTLVPATLALNTFYLSAEAHYTQRFLRKLWKETSPSNQRVRLWSQADFWPVARLEVTRLGVDIVMPSSRATDDFSAHPRHLPGTALPGTRGNSVIFGRPDVYLGFVRELQHGDELVVESTDWQRHRFRVVQHHAAPTNPGLFPIAETEAQTKLTLAVLNPTSRAAADRYNYVVAEYIRPLPDRSRWRRMMAEVRPY